MVFKPAELTPLSAIKLAEILTEAGLPAGAFNVVQGFAETGRALVNHPDVAKVSLTGEAETGKLVASEAARSSLKPVTMELGGKSPLLVFDDADLDAAVSGAMLGNFATQGQVCTNCTRVFVQESAKDAFLEKLAARTEAIRVGDPSDPEVQLGPLISAEHKQVVMDYIDAGRHAGARLVTGGGTPEGLERGNYVEPTIFDGCTDEMRIVQEEIFGPVLSLLTFRDEEDAIRRANATRYGLASGVFTRDLDRAHRCARRLQSGICWINHYNVTPIEMTFGGTKHSGLGRENGRQAIEHYSQLKSVYVATERCGAPF
jgi:betaine-aldehyde dehydrogenase